MAATGRVNVFARVRPGVAREDGDQHCVDMNADTGKCLVRLQDGDAVERVLAGGSAAIRTVEHKGGLDAFLLDSRDGDLSLDMRRLKKQIKNAQVRA